MYIYRIFLCLLPNITEYNYIDSDQYNLFIEYEYKIVYRLFYIRSRQVRN